MGGCHAYSRTSDDDIGVDWKRWRGEKDGAGPIDHRRAICLRTDPERIHQSRWPARQISIGDIAPALPGEFHTFDHLAGPDQDSCGLTLPTAHDVQAPVDAEYEVGIGDSSRSEHDGGTRRRSAVGVRGGILARARVRLNFSQPYTDAIG